MRSAMWRLACGLAAFVVLTPAAPAHGAPARAQAAVCPQVASHAAGPPNAPENTVVGIEAAARTGAPVVEMDVRWSVTGYPVLMHDATVDRTTNGTGTVANMGLGDLMALLAQDYAPFKTNPAFAGVKVPYAWDFFDAANRTGVVPLLDVKTTPNKFAGDKLMEYVRRFPGLEARVIYMASAASIQAMRGWYPGLKYVLIEYPAAGTMRTGEYLRSLGVVGYAVPAREVVVPAFGAYYQAYGLQLLTWSSDTAEWDNPAIWDRVTAAGADTLITNRAADVLARQAGGC